MASIRTFAGLIACCVLITSLPAQAEKRIALIIGNSAYQNSGELENPKNDAELIASALRRANFEVAIEVDANRKTMQEAFRKYAAKLTAAGKNSVGFFYYAGHGTQVKGVNYLLPIDADIEDESQVESEAVSASGLLAQLEGVGNKMNLVILDSCRNNPFKRGYRAQVRGLAPMHAPPSTLIGYSTQPGNVAYDGGNGYSPYAIALHRAIRQTGQTVEQAFKQARAEVNETTDGKQIPWEESSLFVDFYFFKEAPKEPIAASKWDSKAFGTEAKLWKDIRTSRDPGSFRSYLKKHPKGTFSLLANERIERLRQLAAAKPVKAAAPTKAGVYFFDDFDSEELSKDWDVMKRSELQARVTSLAASVQLASDRVRSDVNEFFDAVDYSLVSPFDEYSAEDIKQEIRQSIEDRFYESEVVAAVQTGIKEWIYDADAALREHLDSTMGAVNQTIRDLISQSLAGVDNTINSALGDVGSKIGAGQIDGYAHINGDSLRELRLDGRFQWMVPDEMEFNAYLRIRELDSDGTDGCSFGGEPATEVSLGATDVDLDWFSPNLRASANTKFTFGTGSFLRGMAGGLEITGGLSFEAFEISYLGAGVAFGLDENYLSAACGLRFNKYEGFGGIYFGRTCTLDPIAMWAPDVASVLGNPPFTGAYAYAEAWIPLNEAIGIPSTCLFNISAGVGAGAFYFIEGPTWGGNMLLGVSGEALCVVSVKGEIKLIGVKNGSRLRLKGSGRVEGKAGPCPFCIKFGKTVGLTYDSGSWDVDL